MDSLQAFMLYACPALGALVAFCMFVSPMRAVLRIQRHKQLGETNPLPFMFMIANGVGWLCYGLYIHDFFVFCSNIAALLLGFYYTMTCSKYATEQVQDRLRNLLLAICVVFLVVALVFMGANLGPQGARQLWGITANAILAVYYVTPLSTLAQVVSLRDSSSLYRPLLVANIANGLLWFAYGLATHDLMLTVPNAFGGGFNLISLIISLMFPARANKTVAATCPPQHPESLPFSRTASSTAPESRQGSSSLVVERSASKSVAWLAQAVTRTYHVGVLGVRSAKSGTSTATTAAAASAGGCDSAGDVIRLCANAEQVLPVLPGLHASAGCRVEMQSDHIVKDNVSDSTDHGGDADVEAAVVDTSLKGSSR